MTNPDIATQTTTQRILGYLQIAAAAMMLIFALGFVTGAVVAVIEDGALTVKGALLALGGISACMLTAWWLVKMVRFQKDANPLSLRTRKAQRYLWASGIVGAVIGVVLALSGNRIDGTSEIFSNSPIPVWAAVAAVAIYVIALPILGVMWHRYLDEHEAASYSGSAVIALYAYGLITPIWWLGERAGLLPALQPLTIFVVVMGVWCVAWTWRRGL